VNAKLAERLGLFSSIACAALLGGCGAPPSRTTTAVRALSLPQIDGTAAYPRFHADAQGVLLSWMEDGVRLRVAGIENEAWNDPRTVVEGDDLLSNWADFPSVARDGSGRWIAHWLRKRPSVGFVYDAWFAVSVDEGVTWSEATPLHGDDRDAEHGFVSVVPDRDGFDAFWLDGRQYADDPGEAKMELRHRRWTPAGLGPERILDPDVCTCCDTAAVRDAEGLLVAYRGHDDRERRDIRLVRIGIDGEESRSDAWKDGWIIAACPVNGPALARHEQRAALAWFTQADERPRVLFSRLEANRARTPLIFAEGNAVGRVDVQLWADGTAALSWLERTEDGGAVRVAWLAPDDRVLDVVTAGPASAGRESGFPRSARVGNELWLAWTDPDEPSGLRAVVVSSP